jgi:hypothetical protein
MLLLSINAIPVGEESVSTIVCTFKWSLGNTNEGFLLIKANRELRFVFEKIMIRIPMRTDTPTSIAKDIFLFI